MSKLLTTTDAARLAGVTPSSIKRWADQSLLPCVKTPGGHRRFERRVLERFLREQSVSQEDIPTQTEELFQLLVSDAHYGIVGHLYLMLQEYGAWWRVADRLGPVLDLVGLRWQSGLLSVAEEHIASNALSRALSFVGAAMPSNARGKQCLLAVVEGDQHDLGLRLVDLCLRARQWRPIWLGRDTPCGVLTDHIASGDATLVAVSASRYSQTSAELESFEQRVSAACQEVGAALVLGGNGAWPLNSDQTQRISSFSEFDELLKATS